VALGQVLQGGEGSDHLPGVLVERGDAQAHRYGGAVPAPPDGLELPRAGPVVDPGADRLGLGQAVGWHEQRHVPADGLLGGIPEVSFGGTVPGSDRAGPVDADDGVRRGVDDGGHAVVDGCGALAVGDVGRDGDGGDEGAVGTDDGRVGGPDRDDRAVPAARLDLARPAPAATDRHRPCAPVPEIVVEDVGGPPPDGLVRRPSVERSGRRIPVGDHPVGVDGDDSLTDGVEHGGGEDDALLRPATLGDVPIVDEDAADHVLVGQVGQGQLDPVPPVDAGGDLDLEVGAPPGFRRHGREHLLGAPAVVAGHEAERGLTGEILDGPPVEDRPTARDESTLTVEYGVTLRGPGVEEFVAALASGGGVEPLRPPPGRRHGPGRPARVRTAGHDVHGAGGEERVPVLLSSDDHDGRIGTECGQASEAIDRPGTERIESGEHQGAGSVRECVVRLGERIDHRRRIDDGAVVADVDAEDQHRAGSTTDRGRAATGTVRPGRPPVLSQCDLLRAGRVR
jgi:hypothetical protein